MPAPDQEMAGHLLVCEHRISARKAKKNVFPFSADGENFSSEDFLLKLSADWRIFPLGARKYLGQSVQTSLIILFFTALFR